MTSSLIPPPSSLRLAVVPYAASMRYLVTGGAGFIGSNFIRHLFKKYGSDAQVVNLDKLTYAGIRENLAEYEGQPNYRFLQGDIASPADVAEAYRGLDGSGVDVVVNFAA